MRYFYIGFILLILSNYPVDYAVAMDKSLQSKRQNVLQVFKKAVELNEDFKRSVTTEERDKKRLIVEDYDENVLDKALEDCVQLLSSDTDEELALIFFNLLISEENSADEAFAFSLGELFLNKPDLVVKTFSKFNEREKKFLYLQLYWGWKNIVAQKNLQEEKMPSHLEKLRRLNPGVEIPKIEKGK